MNIDDQIAEQKMEYYESMGEIYDHLKRLGGKCCGDADCKLCATHWDMMRDK